MQTFSSLIMYHYYQSLVITLLCVNYFVLRLMAVEQTLLQMHGDIITSVCSHVDVLVLVLLWFHEGVPFAI